MTLTHAHTVILNFVVTYILNTYIQDKAPFPSILPLCILQIALNLLCKRLSFTVTNLKQSNRNIEFIKKLT